MNLSSSPPSAAGGDELRFIPSPPLRPAQPPPQVSVFLPADEARPQDPPSVFLSEPARPAPPPPQPPRANFQNTFFVAQTNLGQTQTRIPPSRPQQEPFTFFGGQSSSRPVSFPTQQSASSSSSPFVNFNNFRAPEQPRSLQSVFGGQPQPPPNTFFSQDARFDVRPSPAASSQTSPGSVPVQRPGPPATVFKLGPSSAATQRLLSSPPSASQNRQQQNFPTFPQPQFGGFRPIKRHLEVPEDEDEIFFEDIQASHDRSRRHRNKKNKKNHNKSSKSSNSRKHKKLDNNRSKPSEPSNLTARQRMQDALKKGLAKVYYEEFLQKSNDVNYYEDYEDDREDYYYYYYDYYY